MIDKPVNDNKIAFQLKAANDNGPSLTAEFLYLPEIFLNTYSKELLGWASNLIEAGALMELQLWNFPDATVISNMYQGLVMLRCDPWESKDGKSRKLIVQPHTDDDRARVKEHCEVLPQIFAAHKAKHAEDHNKRDQKATYVSAEFDNNIPTYFVERYAYELREWGRNLKKIGLEKTIVLREGNLSDVSPDPEQGAELLGVKLIAVVERIKGDRLVLYIKPKTERDLRIIKRHVEKMTSVGIKATAQLVEPERPGLPFLPSLPTRVGPT